MAKYSINNENAILPLHSPLGKIRIADQNGNHVRKPTECVVKEGLFIEWMITNTEISDLIKIYLNDDDIDRLNKDIRQINKFVKESEFAKREAAKGNLLKEFEHFKIYEYTEKYYSYETTNINNIIIRVVFKMGDFTLNPHFYVLIPFGHPSLSLANKTNTVLRPNDLLGSGAYGIWKITKIEVVDIIKTISYASSPHRNDMIGYLSL